MRALGELSTFLILGALASRAHADVELKNDGFNTGDTPAAQGGFDAGEAAASRYVAPSAGLQLLKVQLLFAGATATRDITFKVWDDTAGTDTPGTELFTGDFTLTGSNSALQQIDLTMDNVIVPQQFRVGIVFITGAHSTPPVSYPSVVRDTDGTIKADKNFILATGLGWTKSQALGLQGDWVIRAFVSGGALPDAGVGGDGGVGGPDAGVGAACQGNTDCPLGQFCELSNHHCTFECRTSADCPTGTCNSLGMCIGAGNTGKGGCCQTDRDGQAAGVLLGIGVLFVMRRRRR
ncbi:MAG: hypothetical protein JWO36_2409 [Myxococcales bacterium]|nr:hypothetical protein [Myxococcales bacterium]